MKRHALFRAAIQKKSDKNSIRGDFGAISSGIALIGFLQPDLHPPEDMYPGEEHYCSCKSAASCLLHGTGDAAKAIREARFGSAGGEGEALTMFAVKPSHIDAYL